jgi:hypothetical protein
MLYLIFLFISCFSLLHGPRVVRVDVGSDPAGATTEVLASTCRLYPSIESHGSDPLICSMCFIMLPIVCSTEQDIMG